MTISRDTMTDLIATGQAQPWTHTLHGQTPTAARHDDTWYVILDGTDHYQPAPEPLATTLTATDHALTTADQITNRNGTGHNHHPGLARREDRPQRPS